MAGVVVVIGSLFSFTLLFLQDAFSHSSNPYVGLLTWVIAPGFLFLGLFAVFVGAMRERRRRGTPIGTLPTVVVDLKQATDRRRLVTFGVATFAFLLLSALGSYHTYHFTESVQFCGQMCHVVMKPELITYQHGSHARVACTECHIGRGATWFVRSKLSGTYQLYATAFNKYPRPVPTPIKNLRPAQETCEQCHWPQKFVGNLERTYRYFLGDETNTPFSLSLLMKVGGADPTHGPEGGIHWHMNVNNTVEYYPTDETRQKIPWVRVRSRQGVVTEYRTKDFTNAVDETAVRKMDCMDCHNRPAHKYQTPNDAVNLAMGLGRIDRSLPWIKTNAVFALTRNYNTEKEAVEGIATFLAGRYPNLSNDPRVRQAISTAQDIYTNNFFPEMKAKWSVYPDNIGHKDWPGCFRCHDGKHLSTDGKKKVKASDCNTCHTILAQGSGADMEKLSISGMKFAHPGDELDENPLCNDCHTGGP